MHSLCTVRASWFPWQHIPPPSNHLLSTEMERFMHWEVERRPVVAVYVSRSKDLTVNTCLISKGKIFHGRIESKFTPSFFSQEIKAFRKSLLNGGNREKSLYVFHSIASMYSPSFFIYISHMYLIIFILWEFLEGYSD